MSILSVYIISDSLGETGEQVAKAAISQFELDDYEIKRFPYVLNLKLLSEILKEASNELMANCFSSSLDKFKAV